MLTLVDAVTDPGRANRANEDGHGASANVAWIIDGATGLGDERLLPGPSDAAWLTATMDSSFRKNAEHNLGPDQLLTRAAEEAQAAFQAERLRPPMENYEIPTAAVLIATFHGDRVEIAELGDCNVLVEGAKGLAIYGGTAEGRALEQANAKRMMAGGGGRGPEVVDFLRSIRNRANTPGGYAIFAPDARCAAGARRHTHPWTGGDALFLTDGYTAAMEDYGLFDAERLLGAVQRDIRQPLAALRQVERDDADCTQYPRFKQSDDATAMLIRFGKVQDAEATTPA